MKKIVAIASFAAFLVVGFTAVAQTKTLALPVSGQLPTVDGIAAASEYPVGAEVGRMKLWLSRTADTVYAAFSGETTGWVSVGFGSLKMNDALMFIGFVSKDGKAQLKIQKGSGHSHGDVESDALIQFAIKEVGGVTTVELALRSASVIAKGATDLPVIFAMGGADSFTTPHRARGSQPVTLQ